MGDLQEVNLVLSDRVHWTNFDTIDGHQVRELVVHLIYLWDSFPLLLEKFHKVV